MSRLVHLISLLPTLALTLALAGGAVSAEAQGFGDRLKKKAQEAAKRKVEERADQRSGEATDAALDKAECAASDRLCKDKAAQAAATNAAGGSAPTGKPGEGVWANYDFTPGERPLFIADLVDDAVGDFPRRLELVEGNMDVVEWNGRRFLRATSEFVFRIPLAAPLPPRFTLEFDMRATYHAASQSTVKVDFGAGDKSDHVICGPQHAGIFGQGGAQSKAVLDLGPRRLGTNVLRCRVMVDDRYAKVYVNETRVANHPNTTLGRASAITISGFVTDPYEIMIGDIRVAAGGRKLYDALAESGRVATQGILFATASDALRPESTPTLKEIGQMLVEHPDLKLLIEGHTDDVGDAKANQALSEKRAAAVKAYLTEKHGIDASRLATKGFGASKPAARGTTPEARQQNRRVELVKM